MKSSRAFWLYPLAVSLVVGLGSAAHAEDLQPLAQEPATPSAPVTPPAQPHTAAPAAPAAAPIARPVAPAAAAPAVVAPKKEIRHRVREEEAEHGYGKTEGLLGPVTLGPTVGIALPHPVNVGLEGRYLDLFGFAFDYGFLPQVTVSSVQAKINAYDARLRWFPFRGSFFIGAAYGKQKLSGSKSQTVNVSGVSVPATVGMDIDTTYIAPQLGWRWEWESGFVVGIDFGWQFVTTSGSTLTTNITDPTITSLPDYQKIVSDVNDVGNKIGKQGLPNITLLQFGYMF